MNRAAWPIISSSGFLCTAGVSLNSGVADMNMIIQAAVAALVMTGFSYAISGPAQADEVEEALQLALEAYQAGDIKAA